MSEKHESDLAKMLAKYQGSITYLKVMVTLILIVLILETFGKDL